jgi:hypothetical protein
MFCKETGTLKVLCQTLIKICILVGDSAYTLDFWKECTDVVDRDLPITELSKWEKEVLSGADHKLQISFYITHVPIGGYLWNTDGSDFYSLEWYVYRMGAKFRCHSLFF